VATLSDLQNAIDLLLNDPLGISQYQSVQQVESKAYEAYIFGLCLRAVRELNVTPLLCGISGTPNPFVFRGGPGQIHSQAKNYGYATFSINTQDFELHAGVEFKGASLMTHEVDVCIMSAKYAVQCRQQPDDPPSASVVAGWECKFYDSKLPKVVGRAFVGLIDDMGTNVRLSGLCSNRSHPQLKLYFKAQRRPDRHFELTPLNPGNENIFVSQIAGALRKLTGA
jgi:hypothetical protein